MSNRTVANTYAQGNRDKGKGSNMFFEGNNIYSYGYHFLMAWRSTVNINGVSTRIAFLNEIGYSNTTRRHKSHVRYALHTYGYPVIETEHINQVVRDLEETAHLSPETKQKLAQEYSARIAGYEQRALKARKSHMIELWTRDADQAREEREIIFSI